MIDAWQGIALNTAPDSRNQIHGDEVAREFGFQGGLVPGVTISAYLVQPAVSAWGLDWLNRGRAHVRVNSPVYDGEMFAVEITTASDRDYDAVLRRPDGTISAHAEVALAKHAEIAPVRRGDTLAAVDHIGAVASPERFSELKSEGCFAFRYHWLATDSYVQDVSRVPFLLSQEGYAHMSFLLGTANWIFAANAHMNPWVHLETTSQNFRAVQKGTVVIAEMSVIDTFEKKDHLFADIEVNLFDEANDDALCRIEQRAIYRLRGVSAPARPENPNE
tara:strand:+ start:4396 stop:5223 length:828 start_codon:yes stop_codon:yes gene_type:complete